MLIVFFEEGNFCENWIEISVFAELMQAIVERLGAGVHYSHHLEEVQRGVLYLQ